MKASALSASGNDGVDERVVERAVVGSGLNVSPYEEDRLSENFPVSHMWRDEDDTSFCDCLVEVFDPFEGDVFEQLFVT